MKKKLTENVSFGKKSERFNKFSYEHNENPAPNHYKNIDTRKWVKGTFNVYYENQIKDIKEKNHIID